MGPAIYILYLRQSCDILVVALIAKDPGSDSVLRFLKHENCHLKSLNCFLSLRLKFAFIIVEECLILHGNHFKGFPDTSKTLNKVPNLSPWSE